MFIFRGISKFEHKTENVCTLTIETDFGMSFQKTPDVSAQIKYHNPEISSNLVQKA